MTEFVGGRRWSWWSMCNVPDWPRERPGGETWRESWPVCIGINPSQGTETYMLLTAANWRTPACYSGLGWRNWKNTLHSELSNVFV